MVGQVKFRFLILNKSIAIIVGAFFLFACPLLSVYIPHPRWLAQGVQYRDCIGRIGSESKVHRPT